MEFNQDNTVVQLCAKGMEMEGKGQLAEAGSLFEEAWKTATTDFEKFTAAHYVARHQKNTADKLKWDSIAINLALKMKDENIERAYPSLYLNIAKCYEDLNDFSNAEENYKLALAFAEFLPEDDYGKMVKSGIRNGIERVKNNN